MLDGALAKSTNDMAPISREARSQGCVCPRRSRSDLPEAGKAVELGR